MFDYRAAANSADHRSTSRLLGTTSWMPAVVVALAASGATFATAALSAEIDRARSYEKSEIFLELNHSDGELGLKAEVEGDGWRRLSIDGPGKGRLLEIQIDGRMKAQGLSELSIETTEPSFDDMPAKEFLARFPEGDYGFLGSTLDGNKITGTGTLSHVMPAAPGNLKVSGQGFPKDCDDDLIPVATKPVMITWQPVTTSHPDVGKAGAVKVDTYEVILERHVPTNQELKIQLSPGATSYQVPASFIAGNTGDPYKFEIAVAAENGNQTTIESCFKVKK